MYQAVELNVNGKILRGCVRVPERGNGRYPAVCFYHGFTVEKVGLMRLHELFARRCEMAGIACIRFDFYGCGESEGEFEEMRFLDEVEQAKAIYQWAAQQAFVDPKKFLWPDTVWEGQWLELRRWRNSRRDCFCGPQEIRHILILAGEPERFPASIKRIMMWED